MVEVFQLVNLVVAGVKIAANHIQLRLVLSDSQLIARAKGGDDDAFAEIVKRYQGFIYRQAWGYLQNDEAAKDATQDVFVTAYEGVAYLRNDSALRQWLYRICRNHCLNIIRRADIERRSRSEAPHEVQPDLPLRVALREMISALDDRYREVIILRYYQDLTYDEIAQVLDIPVTTVKVRLFRAKNKLKKMLGESR